MENIISGFFLFDLYTHQSWLLRYLLKLITVVMGEHLVADACDRLWVLDTGVIDLLGDTKQIASNAIIIFDLKTDKLIRRYELPKNQVKDERFLANMAVDSDRLFARFRLAILDVNAPRHEIEDLESDGDNEESEGGEIYNEVIPKHEKAKKEDQPMNHAIAQTLDISMLAVFNFLKKRSSSESSEKETLSDSLKFLKILIKAFDALYLKEMRDWCQQYIKGSQLSRSNVSLKSNLVFYSVCQAIFYIIAFRSRDLTVDKKVNRFYAHYNNYFITYSMSTYFIYANTVINGPGDVYLQPVTSVSAESRGHSEMLDDHDIDDFLPDDKHQNPELVALSSASALNTTSANLKIVGVGNPAII
uniref:Uncharacterized protein n=1 Tax=Glossina austeni TaxID=7395 RepID=A0A1A9UWP9_GLOAU